MMWVVKLQFKIVKLQVPCMNLEFVEEHKWTLVNLQYILQIDKCKICSKITKIVFILDLLSKLNTKEGKVRRGRGLKHVLTESQN